MKKQYLLLKNNKYEILESSNGDCFIKSIFENKYLFKKSLYISRNTSGYLVKKVEWELKDTINLLLIIVSLILFALVLLKSNVLSTVSQLSTLESIIATLYLVFNLILHELGHITLLKLYGRKPGKVKFKFCFIFPTVTVDTTDSYLLPKFRRFVVYFAGIMVNMYICFITSFFPNFTYCIKPVLFLVIFNLIPIPWVNTDGYYIVLLLLNAKTYKMKKNVFLIVGKILFCVFSSFMLIYSVLNSVGLIV